MKHLLVDTDVILDLLLDRSPYAAEAAELFSLCESGKVKGYLTPVTCSNLYYILRRVAGHERVLGQLRKVLRVLDVCVMDRETVLLALESGFGDFEDALQSYSGLRSGSVRVIITRNVKDYRRSEIGAMTPASYLKLIR